MSGRKTTKSENGNLYDLIRSRAGHWQKKQLGWRRHLHQYPETANEEVRTTAFLRRRVTELGLKIVPIKMKTGLLVELKGDSSGPVVGIRTDIDALPILEQTGLPFKSKLSGRMHACGHDMHMATVLGAAAILTDLKDRIAGTVRFIFQPAEEQPPGGARPMIANGALKNMRMLFGLHVDPRVPTGKIGLRDGVAMHRCAILISSSKERPVTRPDLTPPLTPLSRRPKLLILYRKWYRGNLIQYLPLSLPLV